MWLLVTRADISPYISYLQRVAKAPKYKHITMANRVLRFCKRVPTGMNYKKLPHKPRIMIVADSAYQANDSLTDCIALRGWFIFLMSDDHSNYSSFPGGCLQLYDVTAKKIQVVARSAFSAELRNCYDAVQEGINFAILLHELSYGVLTPQQCVEMRDNGTFIPEVHLCTDNYGLFTAVTKEDPSPGVDASMLFHVKALRNYLDTKHLRTITWTDNRDMLADGLTKGRVKRDAINEALLSGKWLLNHEHKTWSAKTPPTHHM